MAILETSDVGVRDEVILRELVGHGDTETQRNAKDKSRRHNSFEPASCRVNAEDAEKARTLGRFTEKVQKAQEN